ncbi:MAG: hypothetical protein COW19_10920 [Zetaproteobacteria bacterium CG12_big_fil_rev_8_21_14_0_65_55_1124]|nr:MAG: hypothetical protein AUJ58_02120 [Zetaproteobacteria bacterium CG1_02_55_237]PIS18980.1 MAG: hypothetical protein COT53_07955 [Zetaproteobacteria bacterium CG08_land_8_20_14_0_20_55_17]PIW41903.1 MAG: hypothetical protein COW19_10920 [Zetaproteobacteria bacterium CG12_big_fil_rev_8_21_14_0_65_55_1124]PIY53518.1 MAG: hypothetical protein COZ01_03465 [Zetaproteobacteria bacterium CG_4_10_14_0_8_um_filter_55_43]PIZ37388.1 MAG: hypothetical protein COY36_09310 [Zetaproteobacteria bacterium 
MKKAMKKTFKLVATGFLAAVFLGVVYFSYVAYEQRQQRITHAEAVEAAKQRELALFQQRMLEEQQREQEAQRQKAIEDELRQAEEERKLTFEYRSRQSEIAREEQRRREQQQKEEQEKNKNIAWERYYTLPEQCKNPASKSKKDWCFKHLVEAKLKFDQLWAKGLEAK